MQTLSYWLLLTTLWAVAFGIIGLVMGGLGYVFMYLVASQGLALGIVGVVTILAGVMALLQILEERGKLP